MDATTEEKLEALHIVAKRALENGDHKFAIESNIIALTINPVDYISMVFNGIAHHKMKNYKQCLDIIQNAISNADKQSLKEIENIMAEYDLPKEIIVHETYLEVTRKIKAKQMVKIMVLLLLAATPLLVYTLKMLY